MLSIIIVSYNTAELTINCIKSIYNQTKEIDYEIIVVDNNSKDDSVCRIQKEFPNVKLIVNKDNRGFAYALNIGIKKSSGEIILSINSDTLIIDNAIEKSYKFLKGNLQYGILGVKLLNEDNSIQPSCRNLPDIWNCFTEAFFLINIFPKSKIFGRYYMSYFNYDKTIEVDWIKGTYMMIRKEVFEKVGLFDDEFFLYSEETDFMLRAKRKGIKTVFYNEVSIYHFEGSSSKNNPERVYKMVHKTKLLLFKKNFSFPRKQILICIQYLSMINRIVVYFLYGVIRLNREYIKKSFHFAKALF